MKKHKMKSYKGKELRNKIEKSPMDERAKELIKQLSKSKGFSMLTMDEVEE